MSAPTPLVRAAESKVCAIELRRPETVWWNTRPGLTHQIEVSDWRAAMQSTEPEVWKPVADYEGLYEVSDHGRIRSLTRSSRTAYGAMRTLPGVVLKLNVLPTGHLQVAMSREGVSRKFKVHRVVAIAFIGEPPHGTECCHNDGNPANNHVSNLRWGTRSENAHDRVRHGAHAMSNKTHCPQGHEYTDENTRRIPSRPNARYCRACQRVHGREYMRRKRAEGRAS